MKAIKILIFTPLFFFSCKKNSTQIPTCIQNRIDFFKSQPKDSRPYSVTEYLYKGSLVYYIQSACCDQYNPVYNSNCDYLGAPDGGITGGGDKKIIDFFANTSNKNVVWENK